MRLRDLPLLLAAALLLIGGAWQHADGKGESVLAAGLVCLGAWIAVEARNRW